MPHLLSFEYFYNFLSIFIELNFLQHTITWFNDASAKNVLRNNYVMDDVPVIFISMRIIISFWR